MDKLTQEQFKDKINNRLPFIYNEMFPPANDWADRRNEKNDSQINWSWDCGLKLDYDGGLLCVSSRFYPPHKKGNANTFYDGNVSFSYGGLHISEKHFKCETLEQLAIEVESFIEVVEKEIKKHIVPLIKKITNDKIKT